MSPSLPFPALQELGTLFKARDAYEGAKRQLAINDFHVRFCWCHSFAEIRVKTMN